MISVPNPGFALSPVYLLSQYVQPQSLYLRRLTCIRVVQVNSRVYRGLYNRLHTQTLCLVLALVSKAAVLNNEKRAEDTSVKLHFNLFHLLCTGLLQRIVSASAVHEAVFTVHGAETKQRPFTGCIHFLQRLYLF